MYWSTKDARKKCVYTCRIVEVDPHVESTEHHMEDLTIVHDPSMSGFDRDLHIRYTTNTRISEVKGGDQNTVNDQSEYRSYYYVQTLTMFTIFI